MSSIMDLFQSGVYGAIRSTIVELLIYPLDTIKYHQQCSEKPKKISEVTKTIFREGGVRAFYSGIYPQLLKNGLKQVWCWPMITGIPPFLQSYGIRGLHQQIITGLFISSFDALISTPFERAKIQLALSNKRFISFRDIYKDGWEGLLIYWAKRSVNMVTFLVAQKYFRDWNRIQSEQLSPLKLIKIGAQIALIVSVVSAPLDVANTLKLAQQRKDLNTGLSSLSFRQKTFKLLRTYYQGCPINFLSLLVHNVASVTLLEILAKK